MKQNNMDKEELRTIVLLKYPIPHDYFSLWDCFAVYPESAKDKITLDWPYHYRGDSNEFWKFCNILIIDILCEYEEKLK